MQNRGMFPYRRPGGKKRRSGGGGGSGGGGPVRKIRPGQKNLPNSAREMLPLMQPATKALAQVLAGRTAASGQLGHAQALAAHADRLIAERAHNRLTPAEREEFFEQLARLKLTLTDAEVEAEDQTVEEPEPKPSAPPVAKERLRELALALSAPMEARAGGAVRGNGEATEADEEPAREVAPADEPAEAPPERPNRLRLSRDAAESAVGALGRAGPPLRSRKRSPRTLRVEAPASSAAPSAGVGDAPPQRRTPIDEAPPPPAAPIDEAPRAPARATGATGDDQPGGEEASGTTRARRSKKAKTKGLPEGWVIDEEGYVVPGGN
jgi:hypothetical protein